MNWAPAWKNGVEMGDFILTAHYEVQVCFFIHMKRLPCRLETPQVVEDLI